MMHFCSQSLASSFKELCTNLEQVSKLGDLTAPDLTFWENYDRKPLTRLAFLSERLSVVGAKIEQMHQSYVKDPAHGQFLAWADRFLPLVRLTDSLCSIVRSEVELAELAHFTKEDRVDLLAIDWAFYQTTEDMIDAKPRAWDHFYDAFLRLTAVYREFVAASKEKVEVVN